MLSTAILLLFPLCMVFACIWDLLTMRIPNKLSLVLIVGFAIMAPLAGMGWELAAWHVGTAVMVLIGGFLLFAFGGMGAGDVKFATVTSLWLGPTLTPMFLVYVGLGGGAIALLFMFARRFALPISAVGVTWIERLHNKENGIPYGLTIGPAGLAMFSASALGAYALYGTPIG